MENNEVKEVKEYTNGDVLKVLGKMTEEEAGILLAFTNVLEIRNMLNDKEKYDEYLSNVTLISYYYKLFADEMARFRDRVDALLTDEPKDFSSDYDKLSEIEKKQTALEMLNNKDFQKNCCDIIVGDYERIVAEDPTCNALDKLLGIGKYLRKCIETGLGCDHKYEVE